MNTLRGLIDGKLELIKYNEAGTHYYVNGGRISKQVALDAIQAQANRKCTTASRVSKVASAIEKVVVVSQTVSVKEKIELVESGAKDEVFVTLIKLNRKSEPARGFSGKRLLKIYDDEHTPAKTTDLTKFVEVLDRLGKEPVFELPIVVRQELSAIVAQIDAEKLGDIANRKIKTGLSDKQIEKALETTEEAQK